MGVLREESLSRSSCEGHHSQAKGLGLTLTAKEPSGPGGGVLCSNLNSRPRGTHKTQNVHTANYRTFVSCDPEIGFCWEAQITAPP